MEYRKESKVKNKYISVGQSVSEWKKFWGEG